MINWDLKLIEHPWKSCKWYTIKKRGDPVHETSRVYAGSGKGPQPKGVWCRQSTLMQALMDNSTARTHELQVTRNNFTTLQTVAFSSNPWTRCSKAPFQESISMSTNKSSHSIWYKLLESRWLHLIRNTKKSWNTRRQIPLWDLLLSLHRALTNQWHS